MSERENNYKRTEELLKKYKYVDGPKGNSEKQEVQIPILQYDKELMNRYRRIKWFLNEAKAVVEND